MIPIKRWRNQNLLSKVESLIMIKFIHISIRSLFNKQMIDNNICKIQRSHRPLLMKETKNDLDEILECLAEIRTLKFYNQKQHQEQVKLINEYKKKAQLYNDKLRRLGERLLRIMKTTLDNIKAQQQIELELLHNTKAKLIQDDIEEVNNILVSLARQLRQTTTIIFSESKAQVIIEQEDQHEGHKKMVARFAIFASIFIIAAFILRSLEKNLERQQ